MFLGTELTEARRASLLTVANEWSSGDGFAQRVAALSPSLVPMIADDGVTDTLTGSAGNDWYFAHTSGSASAIDVRTGASSQDIVTTI